MKSIDNNKKIEYTINKSKFITFLIKINNIEDINKILEIIKKEYKDATHYCYAYIIDNIKRFNDDKEPSGTAGMPILNVLENNQLNHILCIVVRYFGGIKLGAGGLVRAYTKSVTLALEKTNIIDLKQGYKISIKFNYEKSKLVDSLLKDNVNNKYFGNDVTYDIIIEQKQFNEIENILKLNDINIIKKEDILF